MSSFANSFYGRKIGTRGIGGTTPRKPAHLTDFSKVSKQQNDHWSNHLSDDDDLQSMTTISSEPGSPLWLCDIGNELKSQFSQGKNINSRTMIHHFHSSQGSKGSKGSKPSSRNCKYFKYEEDDLNSVYSDLEATSLHSATCRSATNSPVPKLLESRIIAPNVDRLSPASVVELRLQSLVECVAILCSVDVLKMRFVELHCF